MVIVEITWGTDTGVPLTTYIRDPVLRGDFVCGVQCNEVGVGMRSDGCTEAQELRIFKAAITSYQESVL